MIRVERLDVADVTTALGKAGADGLTECEKAVWFYTGTAPDKPVLPSAPTRAPSYTIYKSPAVRTELERMFQRKCGYCECHFAHSSPTDIEHYRPKNAWRDSNGKLIKPGYYWLAGDWHNLLASCPDCNRERKLVRHASDGSVIEAKSGKANAFPLAPLSIRATAMGEETDEQPLLLNPCRDDPGLHLRFRTNGFIEAAPTPEEAAIPKGATTIAVLGLDRADLVSARKTRATNLREAMSRVCETALNLMREPGNTSFAAQHLRADAALTNSLATTHDFIAMTNEMHAVHRKVDAVACDYHPARAAWEADPTNAQARADFVEVTGRIKGLISPDDAHRDLARELFAAWEVDILEGIDQTH